MFSSVSTPRTEPSRAALASQPAVPETTSSARRAERRFVRQCLAKASRRLPRSARLTHEERRAVITRMLRRLRRWSAPVSSSVTRALLVASITALLGVLPARANGPFVVDAGNNPVAGITGAKGTAVAFGDLDGDGDTDMLLGDMEGTARLRYYENTGSRTAPAFALAGLPAGIPAGTVVGVNTVLRIPAMGDFDNDGDIDVVCATGSTYTVDTPLAYYRNNGNGTFTDLGGTPPNGLPISTGDKFGALRFKDVDFDGDDDVLIAAGLGGDILYFRNDGGVFVQPGLPFGGVPNDIAYPLIDLADVDGDGDFDFFSGQYVGAQPQELLYYRNNLGTLGEVPIGNAFPGSDFTFAPSKWLYPSLVDIDGDGDLDLFAGDYENSANPIPVHFRRNTPPSVASVAPADDATDVSTSATFTITFSGTVSAGAGNLYVKRTSDNVTLQTFAASALNYSGAKASFSPVGLATGTGYYITWEATAFTVDGAAVTGNPTTNYWNFVTTASVNAPPQVSGLPANLSYTEDVPGNLDLAASSFSDGDSADITVTLSVDSGTLGLAVPGGPPVVLAGNGTGTVTIGGPPASIDSYLDIASNITYYPAADANGTPAATLTVTANDGDGSGDVSLGSVPLNITAVNDEPLATNLTQSVGYTEDGGAVALADIVVSDADAGETITATMALSTSAGGVLSTGTFGSATSTYNAGTGVWTVTGAVADVNAALAAVAFTPAANYNADLSITAQVRDAADAGPANGLLTLTGTPVPDAPTVTNLNGDVVAHTEGGAFTRIDTGAMPVVADAELDLVDNYNGASITVVRGGGASAHDEFGFIDGSGVSLSGTTILKSGVSIATFIQTDGELEISFTSANGQTPSAFNVNYIIRNITYRNTSDNPPASIALNVTVSDGVLDSAISAVTVNITAVNDTPAITAAGPFSVAETADTGAAVGDVDANDGEGGASDAGLSYTATGGTGLALFDVSKPTGAITVNATGAAALDYETATSYTLDLQIDDSGGGSSIATTTVTINVTDVAPLITAAQSFPIAENPANAAVVGTVAATGDTDGLTWSIQSGNTGGAFAVDGATGQITVATAAAVDFESVPTFTLGIRATDGTSDSDESVTIAVSDVSEAPVFVSNGGGATASINVAEGATAVTTVIATDHDAGNTVIYAITGGADAALFTIDTNTGVLAFNSGRDFETPTDANSDGVYIVEITATDSSSGELTATQTISVTVTAENEAPVLDADASPTLADIEEDPGAPVNGSTLGSTPVSELVDIGGSLSNVTDPDPTALTGIAVTGVSEDGTLYFSVDDGETWTLLTGAVSDNSALLLNADASTRVYFLPNANVYGEIADAITFVAWDRTSGSNGAIMQDTTVGTAFSDENDAAAITIAPVADTPTVGSPTITKNSDTSAIAITRNPADGAEVTHYKITGIGNGVLYSDAGFSIPVATGSFLTSTGATTNVYFRPTAAFVGAAGFTVQAAVADDDDALGGSAVNSTITVNDVVVPVAQTITFGAIGNVVLGDTVTLSATASSGLPVSFSVVSGPATLSGSTLSFTGVGGVTVRASQAGNAGFSAATAVERSFLVTVGAPPVVTTPTEVPAPISGGTATLSVGETNPNLTYQWQRNGVDLAAVAGPGLTLTDVQPPTAGLYTYTATTSSGSGGTSEPVIVGLATTEKVIGTGEQVVPDVVHPNGNVYDQMILEGPGATLTADPAQITRMSYVDLSGDIVQVEFSGAGSLSLVMDDAGTPAPAANYNQPGVNYVRGNVGIVITGANETTNVSVVSVGRITAVNQTLFLDDVDYDGVANIAFIAIQSANGKFGGVRTGNVEYFAAQGFTGLYAPGVEFTGPINIGDIQAHDDAQPVIVVGSAANVRIAGGNLAQPNGEPIKVHGLTQVTLAPGQTSHDGVLPAQPNQGVLVQDGVEVTDLIVGGSN